MTVFNSTTQNNRRSERGNVLFLILIAVALFAALSYAVTQSTRSGGGDASRETNLVNAAGITQYPASIKTAITRMVISNSVNPEELLFDTPSTFGSLATDEDKANAVFYPTGGGASYVEAPASVMASNTLGTWHFNGANRVVNIGTTEASLSTTDADIIAFLPGVKKAVCDSIHAKLGISPTYTVITTIDTTSDMNYANQGIDITGGGSITSTALDGQPQGCFSDSVPSTSTVYTYYHVVSER
ncbi:MAG: hypothetical protein A3J37_04815 [Alphaproteobacteria bacterium RIFCSPHIGHO2_12_FULL_45_9]|nr:MAG: hypothetical protein A3B66_03350 [Alphaproteobacteria bacterium RIFCSPHIGHO2_02_FULL_46_13]OFW96991.1 MAG: hypothetical protein A3J37_04815 [Alphaproteobacteria bacterium RIFCSPHIGHO2_12_FULL_45_9]